MVAMLVEDATFATPPHPNRFHGRDAVVDFLRSTGNVMLRNVPIRANGQAAIGWYLWDPRRGRHLPASLEVPTLEGH